MKILFVASGNHGGISPVVKVQGNSLVQAGVEVDYYLIKGRGIGGYLRHVRPLKKYCKNNHFDVVHAHFSFSAYVASLAGVGPLVVSLMGSDTKASNKKRSVIRFCARFFKWPVIIVKSKDMATELNLGHRVLVIPNGVDTSLFVQMQREVCLGHLGWNAGVKHILFPANPDRPEKDYALASRAVEVLGGDVEIHFFKGVEYRETVYYYNACDTVLLTSKWEGSPNVIKEALACGCPIVSVDVGDVKERIENVDGCYVSQSRDPEELAGLLEKALVFDGRTPGRDVILKDNLSSDQVAKQMLGIYESL